VPALHALSNEQRKAKPEKFGVHGPRVQCAGDEQEEVHRVESTGVPLANWPQDQGSGIPFRWRQAASGRRPRQGHMQGRRGFRNVSEIFFNPINNTTFVLFDKYYSIMDQLGSKNSSRDFQLNYLIHLVISNERAMIIVSYRTSIN